LRDGGSFTTRRVVASQEGEAGRDVIFAMSASFQKTEPGFEHQAAMPDVPPPDDLPGEDQLRELLPERFRHLADSNVMLGSRPPSARFHPLGDWFRQLWLVETTVSLARCGTALQVSFLAGCNPHQAELADLSCPIPAA
jgi:acyl-CoA thioesterase II